MRVEVSTNLIPVIHVGSYWSNSDLYNGFVCDRDDIEQSILECAPDVVQEAIREICPDATISDFSVYMPREYNYGDDELNFTLDISDADYQSLYDECINDPAFPEFLNKNYSSYDGFFSFMANNTEEFDDQEDFRKVSQLICFQYFKNGKGLQENYQYDYYEALSEWLYNNCPPYGEDLGGNGEVDVRIDYDWVDGKDSFIVYAGNDEVAVFPVDGDSKDATWSAYNEAYQYCVDNLGIG